jgi:hypothetical protein
VVHVLGDWVTQAQTLTLTLTLSLTLTLTLNLAPPLGGRIGAQKAPSIRRLQNAHTLTVTAV